MTMSITEQLSHCVVRIEATLNDGGTATGTSFIVRLRENGDTHVPVIATNHHVIEGTTRGTFVMTVADAKGLPIIGAQIPVVLDDFEARWTRHPDPEIDLAVMPIGPLLAEAQQKNIPLFYRSVGARDIARAKDLADLTPVEDILMIGYPNGIWDATNNLPVFRRGITATAPSRDLNGRPEFLIDAACFPGSSGSPVFLFNNGTYTARDPQTNQFNTIIGNRVKMLGILFAGPQHTVDGDIVTVSVPTKNIKVAVSSIPNNLGYVVRAEKLFDFDPLIST